MEVRMALVGPGRGREEGRGGDGREGNGGNGESSWLAATAPGSQRAELEADNLTALQSRKDTSGDALGGSHLFRAPSRNSCP